MAKPTPQFTEQQILDALTQSGARRFAAAHLLGCSQKTIARSIQRYPSCADLVQQHRGERGDNRHGKTGQKQTQRRTLD